MNTHSSAIHKITLSDDYQSHYRLWGDSTGEDVIIMLHGGMSHSAWQGPLAELVQVKSNISFVAYDRRGCGLNKEARGDLSSSEIVIDDVVKHVEFFNRSFNRVHLAGWCQGCQFASIAAEQIQNKNYISSLIFITPGFFWGDRFDSILNMARSFLLSLLSEFELNPPPDKPFIPIPMQGTDFTSKQDWLDYIDKDDLKTTRVSLNTAGIMEDIKNLSAQAILKINIPILAIMADNDRIVHNDKVKTLLVDVLKKCDQSKLISFNTDHAIHFEKAKELSEEIIDFISSV